MSISLIQKKTGDKEMYICVKFLSNLHNMQNMQNMQSDWHDKNGFEGVMLIK